MVFGVIGMFDLLDLIFILVCICFGKYGDGKESLSAPADITAMSNKITDLEGTKGFDD